MRQLSRRTILTAGAAALVAASTPVEPSSAQTISRPQQRTALVLGGGGAKGAFELGAVTYLYEYGVIPDIICGTSVGAINAAKLAEGPGGLAGLQSLWSSMRTNADMYLPRFGAGGSDILDSAQLVITQAVSLYDAGPIRAKIDAHLDGRKIADWSDQGNQLWISMVDLNTGLLRYVNAKGQVFERDCRTPVMSQPAPLCQREDASVRAAQDVLNILNNTPTSNIPGGERVHLNLVRAAENQLKDAQAAYQACMAGKTNIAGSQQIVIDIRDAVKASASAPLTSSPWACAGGLYVDGGVRTLLPLEAATAAGAHDVYAVAAGVVPPNTELNGGMLLDVVRRSIDLLGNEIGYRDTTRPPNVQNFYLAMPDIEIHDTNVIDPGLIQINRDYGYMRMADVLNGIGPKEQQARFSLPTAIASKRKVTWQLENRRAGQPDPSDPSRPAPRRPDPGLDGAIEQGKSDVTDLLNQRREFGDPLPPNIDTWTRNPELHPWLS